MGSPETPWGFQGPIGALEGRALGPILGGSTTRFPWWNAMQTDASTFMLMLFCQPLRASMASTPSSMASTPSSMASIAYTMASTTSLLAWQAPPSSKASTPYSRACTTSSKASTPSSVASTTFSMASNPSSILAWQAPS